MSEPHTLPFDPIRRAAELWEEQFGADSPIAAMASATSVMRVQQILLARLDAALAPFDLTFARYEALVLLSFSRRGEMPMSKVGERLMIHPTSVTNIVRRLAAQRLVEQVPNPRDGRGTLARITPAGNEVVETCTAALHDIDFGLGSLNQDQHRELFQLLHAVRTEQGDFRED
ncbi:MarR family winged helix-turn-helix transcriptional regulator [Demetria terragena]|uniref:MarR family winged helix-turn-helix transcriptional regulator n=1 Tax=Demetria terragena TaxID=63959 RepID=UPI00035FC6C2|nr:MarR family transcriptional regulator [Demetria terragena]